MNSWTDKMEAAGWKYKEGRGWIWIKRGVVVTLGNEESNAYRTLNEVPNPYCDEGLSYDF